MDELNQALERMRIAFAEKEQAKGLQLTPQHGSTSGGGNLTIAQVSGPPSNQQSQNGSQQQTHTSPHTQHGKHELAKTLAVVCALQKQYGKTQAELEILVEGFSMVLSDRPMGLIIECIKKYIKTNSGIPTPADIENMINTPKQPLSTAMYIKIMKDCTTGGKLLWGEKRDFVEAYEAQETAKIRGGSDELREAKMEIENFRMAQLEYANG